MSLRRRLRLASATEAAVLLLASLLLLVVVSVYLLFAYRGSVSQLLAARQDEADQLAREVASTLSRGAWPQADTLRRLAPQAWAVAIVDHDGVPLVDSGTSVQPPRRRIGWRRWVSPLGSASPVVTGMAEVRIDGRALNVRVDLPALVLQSRARSLELLTPLVLLSVSAVVVVLLLYLRRLLTPIDRLIARARQAGVVFEETPGDELARLLATFDRALQALAAPADDGELAAFQRAVVRSLASGVLLCDEQGRVLALNDVGATLLGVEAPEAGAPASIRSLLGMHEELAALLEQAVTQQATVTRREQEITHAEGGLRTLGLTAHPLRRDDDSVRGFLVLFTDLTAARREAASRQLAESLSQLGELSAGVAHELRNGLATLRGYLGLIARDPNADAVAGHLDEMHHESDHMQRVLDDFLHFARPGRLQASDFDVVAWVERAARDPALEGAAVAVQVSTPVPTIQGDLHLLERALRNVLRNAVQAQQAAGVDLPIDVTVDTVAEQEGRSVEIRIEDRGTGVAPELAERLFRPFVSGRADGVGLGLALSRRLVVLHGGTLTLDNRTQGGACARLRLPVGKSVTHGSNLSAPGETPPPLP